MSRRQRAVIAGLTGLSLLIAATTMWRPSGSVSAEYMPFGAVVVIPSMLAVVAWTLCKLARDSGAARSRWLEAFDEPLRAFVAKRGLTYCARDDRPGEYCGELEGVSVTLRPWLPRLEEPPLVEVVAQAQHLAHRVAVRRRRTMAPGDPAAGLLRVKTGNREFDEAFKTFADTQGTVAAVLDEVTRSILVRHGFLLAAFDNDRDVLRVQMEWSKATTGPPFAEIETALRLVLVLAHRRAAQGSRWNP